MGHSCRGGPTTVSQPKSSARAHRRGRQVLQRSRHSDDARPGCVGSLAGRYRQWGKQLLPELLNVSLIRAIWSEELKKVRRVRARAWCHVEVVEDGGSRSQSTYEFREDNHKQIRHGKRVRKTGLVRPVSTVCRVIKVG